MQKTIWILWPSFIVAIVMEGIFFSLFDPIDLVLGDIVLIEHRLATYTLGFFGFWLFAACSSALTIFLQRNAIDINRFCPLEPTERPVGCPKRQTREACNCD